MLIDEFVFLIRRFLVGYLTGDNRKSINYVVIGKLIGGLNWFSIFTLMLFPIYKNQYQLLIIQHPSIIAEVLTIYALLIIATIRISIDEFKAYKIA